MDEIVEKNNNLLKTKTINRINDMNFKTKLKSLEIPVPLISSSKISKIFQK
jgi:hypothetical protein